MAIDIETDEPRTDFSKLKAGDIPLVEDGEGGWTLPDEYIATHLEIRPPTEDELKMPCGLNLVVTVRGLMTWKRVMKVNND